MTLTVSDCTNSIRRHTEGLAAAAEGNLDKRIEHCPDWSMADLVWHLIGVHRFWNTVVRDLPEDAPDEVPDTDRPSENDLISELLAGMEVMVATMTAADQSASCWTWGLEQNVGFITRHQVQEAAVHHWDAVNAAGRAETWEMDPHAAIDAVDEFLTNSTANPRWPMPDAEPLGGTFSICGCISVSDTDQIPVWHVTDGPIPGTLSLATYEKQVEPQTPGAVGGHVDPAQFLLWLFQRSPNTVLVDLPAEDDPMIRRFRALTSTD